MAISVLSANHWLTDERLSSAEEADRERQPGNPSALSKGLLFCHYRSIKGERVQVSEMTNRYMDVHPLDTELN